LKSYESLRIKLIERRNKQEKINNDQRASLTALKSKKGLSKQKKYEMEDKMYLDYDAKKKSLNDEYPEIIKYIKRLINKYADKQELKERLILNHIISLSNVFGVEATVNMLHFKIDKKHHDILNAFLLHLEYLNLENVDLLDLSLYNILKKSI
jgi:hypothetical protein